MLKTELVLNPQYLNARHAVLSGTAGKIEEIGESGIIREVCFNGDTTIRKDQIIVANKRKFKIRKIKLEGKELSRGYFKYSLLYDEVNMTSMFMAPMLALDDKVDTLKRDLLWDSHLVNMYLAVEGGTVDQTLVVLYRFDRDSQAYRNLEVWFQSHPNFIERIDPDHSHVLFHMRIPEHHLDNYNQFVSGKYSRMDLEYKEKCCTFHGWDNSRYWHQVLFRSAVLRTKLENELGITIPESNELENLLDIEGKETYLSDMIL